MLSNLSKLSLSSNQKQFLFALLLGCVGALINSFPISLAFNISLLLGNITYIIAASFLRPGFTLLCAIITVIPLYFYWGHPNGFITFGLEALFISMLRSRGWYILSADLLYWLVIGMPLTAVFILVQVDYAPGYLLFSTFKQSINAVLYTSLACMVMFTLDFYIQNKELYQPKLNKSLPKWLFHSFWSISAFIAVCVCLFLSTSFVDLQRSKIQNELEISNAYIAHIGNNYINEHRLAIQNLANQISFSITPDTNNDTLLRLHSLYPGFITMFISSDQGTVTQVSPSSILQSVSINELTVKDRPYFIHTMKSQKLTVSPIFQGRGFGHDPIVAVSAPIYSGHNKSRPIGIVEGSLNVGKFGFYNEKGYDKNEIKIVVTDSSNKIIYSSENLGFETLSEFEYQRNSFQKAQSLITLTMTNKSKKNYLYKEKELDLGWKVYSLIEHDVLLKITENLYLIIFLTLFIIMCLASFFAKLFANTLNRPLAFVMQELSKDEATTYLDTIPYDAPIEIQKLYQELKTNRQAILNHKIELEKKVNEQTKELMLANRSLETLANTDTLTGLNNRRYFEKHFSLFQSILSRNNSKMMFIMLDIDNFKKMNDEHGHIFGDYCLSELGKIMTASFQRESDGIARFGGEEFVIISQCEDIEEAKTRSEKLRNEIANYKFECESDSDFTLTVSIGIAFGNAKHSSQLETWLAVADSCLYYVKDNGRNGVKLKEVG